MTQAKRITRRQFFVAGSGIAAGAVLAACGTPSQAPAAPAPAAPKPAATEPPKAAAPTAAPKAAAPAATGKYKDSPLFADLIKAGKLPPVDQRLPEKPYVVQAGSFISDKHLKLKIGKYGGTMQLAQEAPSGDPHIFIGNNEYLLQSPDLFDFDARIEGGVLESWKANDDNTVFTFMLRKGLKWSDGTPVTMEDVKFAWEDVLNNDKITPIFPEYLRAGLSGAGNPGKMAFIDDWTFSITFDKPYGSFLAQIGVGGWRGYGGLIKPKHYLKQFHIKYTKQEELAPKLKEASIPEDQWQNLFNAKQMTEWMWNITNQNGIGHPTLCAWVIQKVEGGTFTFERNPYYWKVDAEGNQLPYMDGIRSLVVQDKESLTTRALMGEFDYLGERASMKKLPLMKEQEATGKIKVYLPRMHRTPLGFHLNLTLKDENWRKVTWDKRFRQALSLAINRPEILKNFYLNQFAHLPSEANNAEYSVDKANALLNEMGMDKKDGEGFRLGPNGKRFEILFEIADISEDHVPMAELIAEYWKKVGVFTTVKKIDNALRGQRQTANEIQASGTWPVVDMWRFAAWSDYLPGEYGTLWSLWYRTQGKQGEEPPAEIKDLFKAHEAFMAARPGTQAFRDAFAAVLKLHRDNQWYFIPVEQSYYATFFTKRIQNVPVGQSELFGIAVMHMMEIWYIEG
jgi:peptide/nickel transport system substrate-binding protein